MLMNRRIRCLLVAALALTSLAGPVPIAGAQAESGGYGDTSFATYLRTLIERARAQGVREETIARMTADLTPNPRVVELDRAQPETQPNAAPPPFDPYRRQHVDAARISAGRAQYARIAAFAPRIEARYGVPVPILLSIWGNETNYGRYTGTFDLSRSLATLAWEGRRRELFAAEFIALLKIADLGVSRSTLVGSWAGAFGNPQFLPSMYLRLAQDGDGDGHRDIWSNTPDTLASIANYFRDAGWRAGEPWGVRAVVPAGVSADSMRSALDSPTCRRVHARRSRWLTVREWRAKGVQPLGAIGDDVLAALIEPDGVGKNAWLLTGNYRVILEYNCSNYYALSVGLLADEIAR
jgi:lytic murein transglycosylase